MLVIGSVREFFICKTPLIKTQKGPQNQEGPQNDHPNWPQRKPLRISPKRTVGLNRTELDIQGWNTSQVL